MKDWAISGRTWTYPQHCGRTRRALVARLGPSTTHTFTCQAARRTVARTSVGAGEGWISTFGRTSRTAARAFRSRGSSIHPRIWPARPSGAAIAGSAQPDGLLRRHFSRFGSGSEYPIGFRSFGRGTRSGAPVRIVKLIDRVCRRPIRRRRAAAVSLLSAAGLRCRRVTRVASVPRRACYSPR